MTAATPLITRHMVTVKGARQVHYRRAGSGPPVVILHQSPTSSAEYIPLITALAREFTVIAPDTPGNGMSDPLPGLEVPEMEDFADAAVDLLDALGLGKVPLYGFHTGGVCALAVGWRHPDRTSVCIMDGYLQMSEAEKTDFLKHYLPAFVPDWTGSHMIWAWSRFREQSIFFPWYRKAAAARMVRDLPSTEALHWAVMEFFRAGDAYRRAYRTPFTFDSAKAVRNMKANMVILTAKTDVLDSHMDILMSMSPPPPKTITTMRPADKAAAQAVYTEIFRKHAQGAAPPVAATAPMTGKIWAEYFQVDGGSLYARRNTDGKGRPIVFVHASAGSSFAMDRFMEPFIGKRPVLAVDLPGNGESDNPMGAELTVAAQAKYLAQAIRAAGYTEIDCFGHWGGSAVAIELAAQNKDLVKNLAIPNVMMPEGEYLAELLANYTPAFDLEGAGTHLVKAWHMVRDQELFAPWYKREAAHVIKDVDIGQLAPDVIHRRTVDLFKMGDLYRAAYAAHFKYPAAQRLKDTACRVLFGKLDDAATKKGLAAVSARGVAGQSLAEFFAT